MAISIQGGVSMKKDINIRIGSRVRTKREYMHLTREEFSEMIDISPQFLADIESGKKGMSFTTLKKICNTLSISCDYVVMGYESEPNNNHLIEMIQNMNPDYLPLAEELLQTFIKTIVKAEQK